MILSIFLPVLPQFEQIGEVCVHAGHAQYTQQPASAGWSVLGARLRVTLEFLSVPKTCCQIPQSWESWAHCRTPTVYRTGTNDY